MKRCTGRLALFFIMAVPGLLWAQNTDRTIPTRPGINRPPAQPPAQPPAKDEPKPITIDTEFTALTKSDSFIIGEGAQTYTAKRSISPFYIGRTEVSYRLWYSVRTKAEERGYQFYNPGQAGSEGRRGRVYSDADQFQPVTNISWYEAIIWCNALSELSGLTPCYTYEGKVLRDSSETLACDLSDCNWEANGFRLPSEAEWEYAARKTANSFISGREQGGAAWSEANTDRTMPIATAGAGRDAAVGTGRANAFGCFDMSGNVLEYCWDWFGDYSEDESPRSSGPKSGSERVSRGGSVSPYSSFLASGDRYAYDPNEAYNYMGFRIASSAKPPEALSLLIP